jgi:hypothetical protein
MGTALMRYAHFTIKFSFSNGAKLRLQSRHIVGVPMENRHSMTRRDVTPEIPLSNEG